MRTLGVLVAAVGLLFVAPTGAAAYDRAVNPFNSCSLSGTPQHNTMQEAVAAASPGEQIGVCPGTYDQTVSINKSVTFTAIGYVLVKPVWVFGLVRGRARRIPCAPGSGGRHLSQRMAVVTQGF